LPKIIWLGRIAGFDAVSTTADATTFGAGLKLSDAAPHLAALHPDLGLLMSRFGSMQVRVSGTVGGNVANGSPIGDLPPSLIALDARVELKQGQTARQLPLEAFFVAYGKQDRRPSEYVRALHVPRLKPNQAYRAYKVSKRFDEDISAVMAAFRFDLDDRRIASARVAYGGMAATPKRASGAEAALAGVSLDDRASWDAALAVIASDFTPLTDMRATAAYRAQVAANLLKRALLEISGAAALTRLGDLVAAE
jgi:xanthine dehydrogenase small subunit